MTTCEASIVKTHKLISCNRIINSDETRLTQSRRRSSRDICYGKQTDRRVGSSVISAVCVCRIGAAMVRLSPCHHTYVWDMEQLDVAEGRNGSDWHRWRKKFPLGRCQMTNTHRKKKVRMCMCVWVCLYVFKWVMYSTFDRFLTACQQHRSQNKEEEKKDKFWIQIRIGSCGSQVAERKVWTLRKARGYQEFLVFNLASRHLNVSSLLCSPWLYLMYKHKQKIYDQ